MANKSGDSSLRDWFKKSKSSDGTPGWVQLGGKYAGKPCAKQPGQKTKPKCGSSKMKRNLNKKEEEIAFRRKNTEDSNPNRKGKAINVKTEETIDQGFRRLFKEKCWDGYTQKGMKKKGKKLVPNCVKEEEKTADKDYDKDGKLESPVQEYKGSKDKAIKKAMKEGKGEKDACYKKVKSRYSVWPSAYASGALVKCRKVGAANWGNKKESYSWRDDFEFIEEGAAWTKKAGKNKSGGLNEKGRKSYERENPGSDLKAPSKKPGNKRRASFCARMKGMKKKLTSAKTARDPDSRINKSLRAWNCGYEPDGTPIMEKDAALDFVRNKYKGQIYDPKKVKKPSEADKAKASAERKKRQDADNKAYASRAKKAGFKSTQDYTNVVARYGSEDNYRKGKGLGT